SRFARPTDASNGDRRLDRRVRVVVDDLEVLVPILEYRRRPPLDHELREPPRLTGELQIRLLEMIQVKMAVAPGPDELARLEVALLCEHVRQERVRRDIERHAEEHVGASLIELARQTAVRDVELEERVTRRQRHPLELADVPCADDDPPRVRISADQLDRARDLIDLARVGGLPPAPLRTVDRPELAPLVRPLVPDRHAVALQVLDVGVPGEEPQKLVDDRAHMQLLRRQQREAVREIEAHLMAEHAECPGSGAVAFPHAALAYRPQQIKVLPHRPSSVAAPSAARGGAYSRLRYAIARNTTPSTIIGADRSWPRVSQPNAM